MKTVLPPLVAPLIAACLVSLVSCSLSPPPGAMVPDSLTVHRHHAKTVLVNVQHAQKLKEHLITSKRGEKPVEHKEYETLAEANRRGDQFLRAAEVCDALAVSIRQSGLFKEVKATDSSSWDYELVLAIESVDFPSLGASYDVKVHGKWILVRKSDKKIVWKKDLTTSHHVTIGDKAIAIARTRLGSSEAMKDQISKVITELSRLSL